MAGDTDPDRPRLTGEDLDRIRARLSARANLGVDPSSPAFLDAILGSIFGDLEGPAALELDEFYDFVEVVARAVIPSSSFGEWLDDWAESLGLARRDQAFAGGVLRFTGTPGSEIAAGQQVTTVTATDDEDPVAFQVTAGGIIDGTGSIDLDATAVAAGSAGNVPAGTLTRPALEIDGVSAVTNPAAMTGGADVESDELLSARVSDALAGDVGAGTQADYRRWGLAWPGVGHVTVRPVARGPGTVDVFITDLNNDPMPAGAVDGLQAQLDPVTGEGLGLAPIGHDVLVQTPAAFAVAIAATVAFDDGYTLDGTAGTHALRATIEAAIGRYVNGLDVGADVVRNKVIAAIVDVQGVADVTALTLNGAGAGDLAVPADNVATINPAPDLTE
jgi:uncharacterized phage protein gp47/JayE